MTQEERTRMLHLTLEAEGLLTLLGERADQTPSEVIDLLRTKIAELAAMMPEKAKPAPESEPETVPAPVPAPESEPEPVPEPEPDTEPVPVVVDEQVLLEEEVVDDVGPDTEPKAMTVADSATALSAADMHNALTLNDRFRFRRALFNNDNNELNEALDAINMMSNAEEARQYFMEDLCWNPEDEDVKEFMHLVEAHFNN